MKLPLGGNEGSSSSGEKGPKFGEDRASLMIGLCILLHLPFFSFVLAIMALYKILENSFEKEFNFVKLMFQYIFASYSSYLWVDLVHYYVG